MTQSQHRLPDATAGSGAALGYDGVPESDLTSIGERVAAGLSRCLTDAGLGCSDAQFERHVTFQFRRGRALEQSLIVPILDADQPHLGRVGRRPYGRRLPSVCLFGYEIGSMVHMALSCGDARRHAVAELSALFNLGISLFDRAGDRNAPEALAAMFDEDRLRRLIDNDPRAWDIGPQSPGTESLGSLLRIVSAFFAELHATAVVGRDADRWRALTNLLIEAYRAEMLSAGLLSNDASPQQLLTAASRKSVAPFEIILHIALVCEGDVGGQGLHDATLLAGYLGTVFSMCDDLADIEADLRSGDLNTIALSAGLRPRHRRNGRPVGPPPDPASIYTCIDDAVHALCDSLNRAIMLLESHSRPGQDRDMAQATTPAARDRLLGYVRSWTNPTSA